MAKPSNFDQLYAGRFLKAGQLLGKKPTLTIADVDLEELEGSDGTKKNKAIIAFEETKMQLVACKTNGICLREMFGKELQNWIGKRVTLFAGQWNGEECLRVWGSPELKKDVTVSIALPRRKPFDMTLHATKGKPEAVASLDGAPAAASVDPRILTAWELLDWTEEERTGDRKQQGGTDSEYLAYLNGVVDRRLA